jgi:transcription elongation factor Elf1
MAFKTKEEQAKYHREVWYPKNKERRMQLNAAWRAKVREQFYKYKKTLRCIVCGENESACLDFHHVDPSNKDMAVGAMLSDQGPSLRRLMQEVDKCVVLCANCHRKHHAGLLDLP